MTATPRFVSRVEDAAALCSFDIRSFQATLSPSKNHQNSVIEIKDCVHGTYARSPKSIRVKSPFLFAS